MPYVISPYVSVSSGLSRIPGHHTLTYLPLTDAVVPPVAVLRRPKQSPSAASRSVSKSWLIFVPRAISARPIN